VIEGFFWSLVGRRRCRLDFFHDRFSGLHAKSTAAVADYRLHCVALMLGLGNLFDPTLVQVSTVPAFFTANLRCYTSRLEEVNGWLGASGLLWQYTQ
jgi:hypothetical protein